MAAGFRWSDEKDAVLKERHGIGFERVMEALGDEGFLDDREHPNMDVYGHQRVLIVEIAGYAWVVPYVFEKDGTRFLKTMFPDRRMTRRYLGESK